MDEGDRFEPDVELPLRCTSCHGKVTVKYRPIYQASIQNAYHCPHCRQTVPLTLPGLLLPPVTAN